MVARLITTSPITGKTAHKLSVVLRDDAIARLESYFPFLQDLLMDRPSFRRAFLQPRFWPLWLGLGLLWLIAQLPYPVLVRIGRGIGAILYLFAHDRRHIAARNLTLCFPT